MRNLLASVVVLALFQSVPAEKLQTNYLPPSTASLSGGGYFLAPPYEHSPSTQSDNINNNDDDDTTVVFNSRSSYAAPPSGPVPSTFYPTAQTSVKDYNSVGGISDAPVATLHFYNDNAGDGSYRFQYETENHIRHEESSQSKPLPDQDDSKLVQGSYSFTAPDGVTYTVNYIADENGFRASGDHLPTPPPSSKNSQEAGTTRTGYTAAAGDSPTNNRLAPSDASSHNSGYQY